MNLRGSRQLGCWVSITGTEESPQHGTGKVNTFKGAGREGAESPAALPLKVFIFILLRGLGTFQFTFQNYISYFSHCSDKIPDKEQFKQGRVCSALWVRKAWQQEQGTSRQHCINNWETESKSNQKVGPEQKSLWNGDTLPLGCWHLSPWAWILICSPWLSLFIYLFTFTPQIISKSIKNSDHVENIPRKQGKCRWPSRGKWPEDVNRHFTGVYSNG